jgi:hypothetical protein
LRCVKVPAFCSSEAIQEVRRPAPSLSPAPLRADRITLVAMTVENLRIVKQQLASSPVLPQKI